MKNIGITKPCSENFNAMQPNEQGAYCDHCEKNVIDFTAKSNEEIKRFLLLNAGQDLCGRLTRQQEETLNAEFEAWSFQSTKSFQSAFLFTLIAVFGLGLFSCSEQTQEQEIVNFQQNIQAIVANIESETSDAPSTETAVVERISHSEDTTVYESEIPDDILLTYDAPDYTREPIAITKINANLLEGGYAGGIGYTTVYFNYIAATTPPEVFTSLAFPNPTVENSTLEIKAPASGEFQIDLYDMSGKHYSEIYSGSIDIGTFRKEIELRDLPAGIYLVTILSANYKETVRISKL